MKCPECGFISFDDMYLCTKCGKIIDADRLQNDFIDQIINQKNPEDELPRPKNFEATLSSLKENLNCLDETKRDSLKASGIRRLAAYLIDSAVLTLLSLILLLTAYILLNIFSNSAIDIFETLNTLLVPFYAFSFLLKCFYFTFFHASTGQTIGKLICRVKVVDKKGAFLSFSRSFLRFLGYYLCFYSFGLGFLWIIFDKSNQGWHDKLAGSIVLEK